MCNGTRSQQRKLLNRIRNASYPPTDCRSRLEDRRSEISSSCALKSLAENGFGTIGMGYRQPRTKSARFPELCKRAKYASRILHRVLRWRPPN